MVEDELDAIWLDEAFTTEGKEPLTAVRTCVKVKLDLLTFWAHKWVFKYQPHL